MADEPVNFSVLDQRDRAAQALHRFPTIAAQHKCRHATTVQIEDHLLLPRKRLVDHLEQAPRQRLPVSGSRLITHVHELDLRVVAADSPFYLRQRQLALVAS